jgi:hypothetical protein
MPRASHHGRRHAPRDTRQRRTEPALIWWFDDGKPTVAQVDVPSMDGGNVTARVDAARSSGGMNDRCRVLNPNRLDPPRQVPT